jgi:chromosome segregation ATPase
MERASVKKAFDGNVAKLKPRMRSQIGSVGDDGLDEIAPAPSTLAAVAEAIADRKERIESIGKERIESIGKDRIESIERHERRDRKGNEGAILRDLEEQLARARDVEDGLRADLAHARTGLVRTAGEAKGALERLAQTQKELKEKRATLAELLAEMNALEEEREAAKIAREALEALKEHYTECQRSNLMRQCTEFAQSSSESLPVAGLEPAADVDPDVKEAFDLERMIDRVIRTTGPLGRAAKA